MADSGGSSQHTVYYDSQSSSQQDAEEAMNSDQSSDQLPFLCHASEEAEAVEANEEVEAAGEADTEEAVGPDQLPPLPPPRSPPPSDDEDNCNVPILPIWHGPLPPSQALGRGTCPLHPHGCPNRSPFGWSCKCPHCGLMCCPPYESDDSYSGSDDDDQYSEDEEDDDDDDLAPPPGPGDAKRPPPPPPPASKSIKKPRRDDDDDDDEDDGHDEQYGEHLPIKYPISVEDQSAAVAVDGQEAERAVELAVEQLDAMVISDQFILHDMHFNANHAYSADSHFENQHFRGMSAGHTDLGALSD